MPFLILYRKFDRYINTVWFCSTAIKQLHGLKADTRTAEISKTVSSAADWMWTTHSHSVQYNDPRLQHSQELNHSPPPSPSSSRPCSWVASPAPRPHGCGQWCLHWGWTPVWRETHQLCYSFTLVRLKCVGVGGAYTQFPSLSVVILC